MAKRIALLVIGAVVGSLLTLAVLAVVAPVRLFGVTRNAVEYSLFRHAEGTAHCERAGPGGWRCVVFDGQASLDIKYDLIAFPGGCWRAKSSARTLRGCLTLRDYVRVLER